jgi:hypothetical protein
MRSLFLLLLVLPATANAQKSADSLRRSILLRNDTACVSALQKAMEDLGKGIFGHRSSGNAYERITDSLLSARLNVTIFKVGDTYNNSSGCYNTYMYKRIEEKYGTDVLRKIWREGDSLYRVVSTLPKEKTIQPAGGIDSLNRFLSKAIYDLHLTDEQQKKFYIWKKVKDCRCRGKEPDKRLTYTILVDSTGKAQLEPVKKKQRNIIFTTLNQRLQQTQLPPLVVNGKPAAMTIPMYVELGTLQDQRVPPLPCVGVIWYQRKEKR